MVRKWGVKGQERQLLRLLAESALNDYPNPERIACPGPDFLRTLAYRRKLIPVSDPRLDHVVHCSPCFREFTNLQATAKRQRNRQWAAITTVAAVIAIGVALWITGVFARLVPANHVSQTQITAQINLQNRSVTRGSKSSQENEIIVPRGQIRLTILLPFGSDEGTYQVQILREVDRPLADSTGQASSVEGVTRLSVSLNTSSLAVGKYLLGIRHPPLGWAFNPITVQ